MRTMLFDLSPPTRRGLLPAKAPFYAALILFLTATAAWTAETSKPPIVVAMPEAFESLLHPNCSHCFIEGNRRKADLRPDDRLLCWMQVPADGYVNDGAIPLRFFLNTHRILDDGWGLFVYDLYTENLKMRIRYNDAVNLLVFSEQLGIPLMNSYVSMRLLPYFVGDLEHWKRRELRERDFLDDAPELH